MNPVITLRAFEDSDIPLFKRWLYEPHVAEWYHDPQDWIEEVEKRTGEFSWLRHFIVERGGKPIGFCQYYEYINGGETWHGEIEVSGTYSIDYMIGEASCLKKGYGREIALELIRHIKTQDNARRIIAQPEPENNASCNTLLSSGYVYDERNELYIINI